MAGKNGKGYAEAVRAMEPTDLLFADKTVAESLCREASRLARRDGWGGHLRRWKVHGDPFGVYCVMRVF